MNLTKCRVSLVWCLRQDLQLAETSFNPPTNKKSRIFYPKLLPFGDRKANLGRGSGGFHHFKLAIPALSRVCCRRAAAFFNVVSDTIDVWDELRCQTCQLPYIVDTQRAGQCTALNDYCPVSQGLRRLPHVSCETREGRPLPFCATSASLGNYTFFYQSAPPIFGAN